MDRGQGAGVAALGGAAAIAFVLWGLDSPAMGRAPLDHSPAPSAASEPPPPKGEALERLETIARRGGERREIARLVRAVGPTWRDGNTLETAIAHRRVDVVDILLELGARPDGGRRADPPLLLAAAAGDGRMVRLLLFHGANPDPAPSEIRNVGLYPSPLVAAVCAGSLDCADLLVRAGADPRRPVAVTGMTLDVMRRPTVLRTTPKEARRVRRLSALELSRLAPNPLLSVVMERSKKSTL